MVRNIKTEKGGVTQIVKVVVHGEKKKRRRKHKAKGHSSIHSAQPMPPYMYFPNRAGPMEAIHHGADWQRGVQQIVQQPKPIAEKSMIHVATLPHGAPQEPPQIVIEAPSVEPQHRASPLIHPKVAMLQPQQPIVSEPLPIVFSMSRAEQLDEAHEALFQAEQRAEEDLVNRRRGGAIPEEALRERIGNHRRGSTEGTSTEEARMKRRRPRIESVDNIRGKLSKLGLKKLSAGTSMTLHDIARRVGLIGYAVMNKDHLIYSLVQHYPADVLDDILNPPQ